MVLEVKVQRRRGIREAEGAEPELGGVQRLEELYLQLLSV